MGFVDIDMCRRYLRAQGPSLKESAAWLAINEHAALGKRDAASALVQLLEESDSDDQLSQLAAGPVRELFLSEGDGYEKLLSHSQESPALKRVLSGVVRYSEKVVALQRALRSDDDRDRPTYSDIVLNRLKSFGCGDHQLPPLPSRARARASTGGETSSAESSDATDLDTMVSGDPVAAWRVILRSITMAQDADEIASVAWYLGLLLDSAGECLEDRIVAVLGDSRFRQALEAAGVDGLREDFIDRCLVVLAG